MVDGKTIVGIDPGVRGALGRITFGRGYQFIDSADMPVEDVGKTTKINRVNAPLLAHIIRLWAPTIVVVERVQPMPSARDGEDKEHRMGTMGAFSYGHGCGVIEGVLRALGHEPIMVVPSVWKRAAGLIGPTYSDTERKRRSRMLALDIWPDAPFDRAQDSGRAEACLIARFGFSGQAQLV